MQTEKDAVNLGFLQLVFHRKLYVRNHILYATIICLKLQAFFASVSCNLMGFVLAQVTSEKKTQEFLVLARQFLTEVRDKIYCLTDEIMRKAGHYDPSGYFFIEDVFCNDTRDSTSIDYSKPILDWLENSKTDALEKWEFVVAGELQQKQQALLGSETKQQLPRLKAVHMLTTRFCDIRFRLGAGYLYRHQGNCKHAIVIRNLRLIHPEDMQNRAAYPLATFQLKFRYRKCSVCKICKAQKIAVDDKWASSNPSYFCDVCYYMLHYVNGSLLYNDFSAHDYHPE